MPRRRLPLAGSGRVDERAIAATTPAVRGLASQKNSPGPLGAGGSGAGGAGEGEGGGGVGVGRGAGGVSGSVRGTERLARSWRGWRMGRAVRRRRVWRP